jgi:hypothetical protein
MLAISLPRYAVAMVLNYNLLQRHLAPRARGPGAAGGSEMGIVKVGRIPVIGYCDR